MSGDVVHIVVIGGGFTGAAFAAHLMRGHHEGAKFDISIIEERPTLGAGLAYSTSDPSHRVNVAANRLLVFSDDPEHFDRWYRASPEAADDPQAFLTDGRAYPRRACFGRYMDELVRDTARQVPAGLAIFRHIVARAVNVTRQGKSWVVTLGDGKTVNADVLAVATSHPAPSLLPALRPFAGKPGLIENPWAENAFSSIRPDADVLVIGTGLTMGDVVASLDAAGHRGRITAISRRGLTSRPRTLSPVEPYEGYDSFQPRTALSLLRRIRADIASGARCGIPWESIIDAVRQNGSRLWAALPPSERLRLLRRLRPFWDVHRYQLAPQVENVIARHRRDGSLEVKAASIRSVEQDAEGRFHVVLHPRHADPHALQEYVVDVVVNCTGPAHGEVIATNAVLSSMADAGFIRPDRYGLGLDTDERSRAIGRDGTSDEALIIVGPLARGTFGELMGLPQVSFQAEAAAHSLLEKYAARSIVKAG